MRIYKHYNQLSPSLTFIPFLLPRQGAENPTPILPPAFKVPNPADHLVCRELSLFLGDCLQGNFVCEALKGMLPFRLCSGKQSFCLMLSNTLHYNALNISERTLEPCRMHKTVMPKWSRIE